MKGDGIKLVLAEDEEMIATAYKMGLEFNGYDVVIASDGQEALAALKSHKPDLLLLDLIMPNMNGFETLKALRADPAFAALPVIVISNLSQPNDEERARELGANDYLIKADQSLDQLMARIQLHLADSKTKDT